MPRNKFLSALIGLGLSIAVGAICFLICFIMQANPAIKDAGNQVGIFTSSLGLALVLFLLFLAVYFKWHVAFRIIFLALGGLLSLFGALSVTRGAFLAPDAANIYGVALMNILPGFVIVSEYAFLRRNETNPFDNELFIILSFPISLVVGFIFSLIFAIFRENAFVGGWLTLILYVGLIVLVHFVVKVIKLPHIEFKHRERKPRVKKEKKQKEQISSETVAAENSKQKGKEILATASKPVPDSFVTLNATLGDCEKAINQSLGDFWLKYKDQNNAIQLEVGKMEDCYIENGYRRCKNLQIFVKFNRKDFLYKAYAEKHLTGDELNEYNRMANIQRKAGQNLSELDDWADNGGEEAMQAERDSNADYNSEHYFSEKSNDLSNDYHNARQSNREAANNAGANMDDIAFACFANDLLDHVQDVVMGYVNKHGGLYKPATEDAKKWGDDLMAALQAAHDPDGYTNTLIDSLEFVCKDYDL